MIQESNELDIEYKANFTTRAKRKAEENEESDTKMQELLKKLQERRDELN